MSVQPFTVVSGPVAYLPRTNVDTDVIIRIERLTTLTKDQLGPYAFEALRYREDGSEDEECVFNRPMFRNAPFLLTGKNFGCGSSREPAVAALQCLGIRCVIAPSFGDIFFSNCFQNGVLPIRLPAADIDLIAAACANGEPLSVDLNTQMLRTSGGFSTTFMIDPLRREALLQGLDDIGLTLRDEALIAQWQQKDRQSRPWAWPESG